MLNKIIWNKSYKCTVVYSTSVLGKLLTFLGNCGNLHTFIKRTKLIYSYTFTALFLFTSQGIVISFHYTIPWQKSLFKSQAWRCFWCKIVIVCHPIRMMFSIRIQWIKIFHFLFQRRTCFIYEMRDRLLLVPYDPSGTNQIEAQLFVATFVKGLCRGTISLYLDVWGSAFFGIQCFLSLRNCEVWIALQIWFWAHF